MAQIWDPHRYRTEAGFVARLGEPLLELLAPRAGERVLDLGCGDGSLTQKLADAGCAVIAVDSSAAQVAAARERGLDARVADGQRLEFEAEFDAVFTNAALHWMPRQDAVVAGVRRALKPGGRFVGELGGAGNVASLVAALEAELAARGIASAGLNPWTFPSAEAWRALLEGAGFGVEHLELFSRPTRFEREVADWLTLMAQSFLAPVPAAARDDFLAAVTARLRSTLFRDGVWTLDYVRLRFAARLPA
ncbi:MAG TPA: methyltransferase domain-containing protein [Gammaproteobacteria bacterium]|nr:methyltransferase domain-containing protein [Gammaproteobacteria bacterium]